jgi:simple sugar transport system permease protein
MSSQTVTPQAPAPAPAPADERLARVGLVARLLQRPEFGALLGAIAVFVAFSITGDQFGTLGGAARWTDVASTYGIMAVVVALLMIAGEFDLSAGVMTGTAGLLLGLLMTEADLNTWLAIGLTLLFAAAVGALNGIVVVSTRLPSFIVTLATFFVLRGLNLGVTKQITGTVRVAGLDKVPGFDAAARIFASDFWSPYGFRISLVWWIGFTLVATWVLMRTRIGNWIFAVGGDAIAARNVGVPVSRVKIGLFITTSVTAALVGVMIALRLKSAQAGQGVGLEFYYIIAAVVGGCLLTGGYGSAIGASLGALIIGMAFIGIPFSGWDSDWYYAFLGAILLAAVLVNNVVRRRAQGARR